MIYIFYGTDEFQTSQELSSLKKELDDGMLDSNTTILQGRGLTAEILIQNIMAIPFLSSNRLVIVEGLIAALGSRKGTLEKWTSLLELLPTIPSSNHLVFIELPTIGKFVKIKEEICVIESVKAASDIFSPLEGEIIEVNKILESDAAIINRDAENTGWIFKLKVNDLNQINNLMNNDEYTKFLEQ